MDTHRLVAHERTTVYDEDIHMVLPVTFKVPLWRGKEAPQDADREAARQKAEALGLPEVPITPEERRIVKLGRLVLPLGWQTPEESPGAAMSLAH